MPLVTLPDFQAALQSGGGAGARTARELAEERLDAHLAEATDEVTGRLTGAFVVPTTPDTAPPMLQSIVTGIAAYTATLEYFGSQPLEPRDPMQLRYDRAMQLLARVASGAVKIAGLPERTAGAAAGVTETYGDVSVGLAETFTEPHWQGPGYFGGW